MGTSLSRNVDLSTNEYLLRFVNKEYISPNDPFWNRFLTFNITPPVTRNDQLALDSRIEQFCHQFLLHNLLSGNFGALIHVFLTRVAELLAATNDNDNLFSWQIFNALFVIRCILKYLIEVVAEEQVLEHIEYGANGGGRLENFVGALFGILVDVPLVDHTYAVHLEAVTCLLVLLSAQVHLTHRSDQLHIFKLMMKGRHALHAPLLIKNLLRNFVERRRAPSVYGNHSGHHSIVFGIAVELWSMITFNRKDGEVVVNGNGQEAPLSMYSLLLIVVLANHCTSQMNPYRQSLFNCVDSQDTQVPPTKTTALFKIDFRLLYSSLCKQANGNVATLLLYLLLHQNRSFRSFVFTQTDVDQLILPILKTLYDAPNSNSHHIYMSLIVLLILSEDESFNRNIHESKLKSISWYTERSISDITLGGLLILVVIRTIQYNMLKMRDKYLHTNCLAALANMSAQFRDLHPYVSQRIVSLFETLAKRYMKIRQKLDAQAHGDQRETTVEINGDESNTQQDLMVVEEVLVMVLEIINSCLSHQLVNNPNLVYTLLYKKHIFEPFKTNAAFSDLIKNVDCVVDYFSQLLSDKSEEQEVDFHEVLSVIIEGAKRWSKDKLTKFPDLKFKYVEEDQPEEFFIPYVWSLVNEHSILHWSAGESSLLSNVTC